MSKASDTLVIAKIGAPYGVKGWFKVTTYTDEPENVFSYSPWLISQTSGSQSYLVEKWRWHNSGLIVKLQDVDSRDAADSLKNLEVGVTTEQLPPLQEDDFYWRELIGMQVTTEQGYNLGTVSDMFETGANDVLIVKANVNDAFGQKQRMIPYLYGQVIKSVDKQAQMIEVDWDPGF